MLHNGISNSYCYPNGWVYIEAIAFSPVRGDCIWLLAITQKKLIDMNYVEGNHLEWSMRKIVA